MSSDCRRFDLHRAVKAAYQGRPVRDALRRLHIQQKHLDWPACRPAPAAAPAASQAPQTPAPVERKEP